MHPSTAQRMANFSPHRARIQVCVCNSLCQIPCPCPDTPDPKVKEAEMTSLVSNSFLPISSKNLHNLLSLHNKQ